MAARSATGGHSDAARPQPLQAVPMTLANQHSIAVGAARS